MKYRVLLIVLVCIVILSGCSRGPGIPPASKVSDNLQDESKPMSKPNISSAKGRPMSTLNLNKSEVIDEIDEPENYGFDLFEKSEIGEREIVKCGKGIELVKESGPFTIRITDIQVLNFHLLDEYKEDFDNKDKLTIITMAVEVENNSASTNIIYPSLGILVTNTEEQVEADLMLSDSVGGEFGGEVVQKGNILFIVDSEGQDIKGIRYIIDGAEDEDFNSIGEDIEFEIEF